MPSGTVTHQDSVCARRNLCADFFQVLIHRLGIGNRHDDGRADSALLTDRAEQID
jgi:hypothetical protein